MRVPLGRSGVRAGHAPVVASAGGLVGLGEGCAEHYGVGAGGYGLADVAAGPEAAVGDDGDVPARPAHIFVSGGGAFKGGGDLRHPNAENFPTGARGAGPDTHQQTGNACLHKLQGRVKPDGVSDDHRNRKLLA